MSAEERSKRADYALDLMEQIIERSEKRRKNLEKGNTSEGTVQNSEMLVKKKE